MGFRIGERPYCMDGRRRRGRTLLAISPYFRKAGSRDSDLKTGDLLQIIGGIGFRCLHDGRGSVPAFASGTGSRDDLTSRASLLHGVMKAAHQPDAGRIVHSIFEVKPLAMSQQMNFSSSGSYFLGGRQLLPGARSPRPLPAFALGHDGQMLESPDSMPQ